LNQRLARSFRARCRMFSGRSCIKVRVQGQRASTVFSIAWVRSRRTFSCWFLLITPDYGMRSGLASDQILAVARIFTAVFLRCSVPSKQRTPAEFPFSGMGRQRNKVSLYGDWLMRYKPASARIWLEED
jgi:hypothetical protein